MKGLFRVKRMPFGINNAPAVFQRLVASLLAGIPGVVVLLDDILITGGKEDQCWLWVHRVQGRIDEAGLRLKKDKYVFAAMVLGDHPTAEKVKVIHEAPAPTNKKELQLFLGLLNFYERFLCNKASIVQPLHGLLDHRKEWEWL
ncbi:hypothetical protein PR048_010485 [Dryococelus australis]|uniref:Reverse transcriptase domain-containing protein n=1 Tax=Dryococelus australis TaxID=614101 RepID=A0ABQ9I3Q0_9NEOP|nr:hypothetical protein PR048_010485 [Dryococelus australis]